MGREPIKRECREYLEQGYIVWAIQQSNLTGELVHNLVNNQQKYREWKEKNHDRSKRHCVEFMRDRRSKPVEQEDPVHVHRYDFAVSEYDGKTFTYCLDISKANAILTDKRFCRILKEEWTDSPNYIKANKGISKIPWRILDCDLSDIPRDEHLISVFRNRHEYMKILYDTNYTFQ